MKLPAVSTVALKCLKLVILTFVGYLLLFTAQSATRSRNAIKLLASCNTKSLDQSVGCRIVSVDTFFFVTEFAVLGSRDAGRCYYSYTTGIPLVDSRIWGGDSCVVRNKL